MHVIVVTVSPLHLKIHNERIKIVFVPTKDEVSLLMCNTCESKLLISYVVVNGNIGTN